MGDAIKIKLIYTLICESNMELFLQALCDYCNADFVSIIEDCEYHRQYYTYSNDDIDMNKLVNSIENKVYDANVLIVKQVTSKNKHIGYFAIQNTKSDKTNYILEGMEKFIGYYLSNMWTLQDLHKEAKTDKLTNLYNRNEYIRRFKELEEANLGSLGIIFIDINSLKEINNKYGHSYGDDIIKSTAKLIKEATGDLAYRFGGDEFVVIMPDITIDTFKKIVHKINNKFVEQQKCSISMGTCYRNKNVSIMEQIGEADSLMYEQKKKYYSAKATNRRKKRRDINGFMLL